MTRSGTFKITQVDPDWERKWLEVISEPRLEEDAWYLIGDPDALAEELPITWGVDRITWSVRFAFSWDPHADPLYFKPPRGIREKLRWVWRVARWTGPPVLPELPLRYSACVTLRNMALTHESPR